MMLAHNGHTQIKTNKMTEKETELKCGQFYWQLKKKE